MKANDQGKIILCSDLISCALKIKRPFRRPGKVILPTKAYENLFQFLAGYLNSDFDIYGPELKDAVAQFIEDCPVEITDITRIEIADFLRDNADTLEDSRHELSSDIAREPGMSARDYLLWVDGLLEQYGLKLNREAIQLSHEIARTHVDSNPANYGP